MNPKAEALKARTKKFALDVLELIDNFPERGSGYRIAMQLTDSSTSVAANYRSACRSRSDQEFAAKIGQVLEEADESLFWLEIADARCLGPRTERLRLLDEAGQLTAIFVASTISARRRIEEKRVQRPREPRTQSEINLKSAL